MTLYIYTDNDDLVASFTGDSNEECEDEAFCYLGLDGYYATYTEQ